MYEWFLVKQNRVIYFSLISILPVALLIGFSFGVFISELSDSVLNGLISGYHLWSQVEPVLMILGLLFVLVSLLNVFRKKPAKNYFQIGFGTVLLVTVYWILIELFIGPPTPLY